MEITWKLMLHLCSITNTIINNFKSLWMALLLFTLSGCQLVDNLQRNVVEETTSNKADISLYYLSVKRLNNTELSQEITKQKTNKQSDHPQTDLKLMLLHSLPNSPIYNPYTAKAMLNDYPLAPDDETVFSATDLAFIVMLKDQLNQQLLLLEQLTNYKGVYKQTKVINSSQQMKIDQLHKQIIQLKKIEKTISNRGQ